MEMDYGQDLVGGPKEVHPHYLTQIVAGSWQKDLREKENGV